MKLAVIEISTLNHSSMIYNWVLVCNLNGWDATVYSTRRIFDSVSDDLSGLRYRDFICEPGTGLSEFMRMVEKDISAHDIDKVIFNTAESKLAEMLRFRPRAEVGYTIHNANLWFSRRVFGGLHSRIQKAVLSLLRRRASFFVLTSDNMQDYVAGRGLTSRPLYVMPPSLRRYGHQRIGGGRPSVVCPGGVDGERKRYDGFLELARRYPDVDFVLLGSCEKAGQDIKHLIDTDRLDNLITYQGYVSSGEFDLRMSRCSVLFSDIKVDFRGEVYGVTKFSGISNLMYEYSLPCFLNKEFANIRDLDPFTVYFDGRDELLSKFGSFYREHILAGKDFSDEYLSLPSYRPEYYAERLRKEGFDPATGNGINPKENVL